MTVKNHYGKWVDSEEPITGVISNNNIDLDDALRNSIDLDYENWVKEENPTEEEKENYESYDNTFLIGSWKTDTNGLYEPDEEGEYSAIMREDVTQVLWSIHTKRCALCSPCYRGQGDLDSDGEFLSYTLPPDMIRE